MWSRARIVSVLFAALTPIAQPARAQEPFTIDVVTPLTGGASFVGEAAREALEIEAKTINASGGINGRPVRFAVQDDQSSPQTAVQLATRIIAKKTSIMLGSSISAMCNAMMPLMRNGPVMYCFSPALKPPPGSFAFTATVATDGLLATLLRYFKERGLTRIAYLVTTDSSGQDGERSIRDAAARPASQVDIVAKAYFNPTDVTISAQIEQIRAAAPQVLIVWTTGATMGTALKSIAQAGLDIPIATSPGNLSFKFMRNFAAELPKDYYIPANSGTATGEIIGLDPRVVAAKKVMYDAFAPTGTMPENSTETVWDPAMIAVAALRTLGVDAEAEKIRDYIAHLKNYAGVSGIYDFERIPQRGLDGDNGVVVRWDKTKQSFVAVSRPGGRPM
jgi:branched-chain amino acid transport system substrate-binding protein